MDNIDWNMLFRDTPALPILCVLGAVIAVQCRKAVQAVASISLKERMIDRGYTAGEIERVLRTDAGADRGWRKRTSCAPAEEDVQRAPSPIN